VTRTRAAKLPCINMRKLILIVWLGIVLVIRADWKAEEMEFPGELRGTITWVSKDGMLVEGAFKRNVTSGDSIFPGPFFLTGFIKEAVDGMGINVKALPAGTYTYVTVLGASRTVKALRCSNE
jgi:hypothetical protein